MLQWTGVPHHEDPYLPTTCAAGAGPGAGPEAGPGAGRCVITAERRYQGRSPKPPPVWAGSRLSKGLGVAEMAFSLFQSMVLFRVVRSVCHGGLWSPNQSYLHNDTPQLTDSHMKHLSYTSRNPGILLDNCVQLLAGTRSKRHIQDNAFPGGGCNHCKGMRRQSRHKGLTMPMM